MVPLMSRRDSFPLRFEDGPELRFRSSEANFEISLRTIRVLTQLCIHLQGREVTTVECLIDTGASISVFPRKTWMPHWIRPLEPASDSSKQATRVKGVLDDSQVPAQVGHIDISVRGISVRGISAGGITVEQPSTVVESPRFTILAKFVEVESSFNRIVLGMEALERWRALEVDFSTSNAYLLGTPASRPTPFHS